MTNPLGAKVSEATVSELADLVKDMKVTSSRGSRVFSLNGELKGQVKLNDLVKRAMELSKEEGVDHSELKRLISQIKNLNKTHEKVGNTSYRTIATKWSFEGNRKQTLDNLELETDIYVKITQCIVKFGKNANEIAKVISSIKEEYKREHKNKDIPKEINFAKIVVKSIPEALNIKNKLKLS